MKLKISVQYIPTEILWTLLSNSDINLTSNFIIHDFNFTLQ